MCPLFRGSTVHKEEDNLSIVDKMAGPNVSFIQRLHCRPLRIGQLLYDGQNGCTHAFGSIYTYTWTNNHTQYCLCLRSDIQKIHGGIGDNLAILIQLLSTAVGGFVIGFVREWRLTLLLLGATQFITATIAISSLVRY